MKHENTHILIKFRDKRVPGVNFGLYICKKNEWKKPGQIRDGQFADNIMLNGRIEKWLNRN